MIYLLVGFIVFIVLANTSRQPLIELVQDVFTYRLLKILIIIDEAVFQTRDALLAWSSSLRGGLRYGTGSDKEDDGWHGWDLVGPIIYFILFLILAAGELYLSSLRFAALFQIEGEALSIGGSALQVLSGLLLASVVATWALVAFDIAKLSPLGRPFYRKKWINRVVYSGFILSVFSGGMFFLWGQGQIEGVGIPNLSQGFIFLFGILLAGSVGFSGWAAVIFPVVVLYILSRILILLSRLLTGLIHILGNIIQFVDEFLIKVIEIVGVRKQPEPVKKTPSLSSSDKKRPHHLSSAIKKRRSTTDSTINWETLTRERLRRRDKGKFVRDWQVGLNQMGYRLKEDNVFGARTAEASKEFHEQMGLPPGEDVTYESWIELEKALNEQP